MRPNWLKLSRTEWIVLVFAIAVRIGAAWVWQDQLDRSNQTFRFGDSHSYWTIASQWIRGQGYQYGSENSMIFRAPLYPLFLGPFTLIGSPNPSWLAVFLVRAMGCVLGGFAVGGIMIMTRQISDHRTSVAAGLLASIYPGAVGMSIFVLSEAIATPLFVLSCIGLLLAIVHRPTPIAPYVFTSGMALGMACLARPSWSLWPLIAIPFFWFASNANAESMPWTARHRAGAVGVLILGILGIMTPWWVRNFAITGKFVPTTLQVGASLYDGWHPGASGSSDENMDFVLPFIIAQKAEDEMLANQGTPLESTLEWRIDNRMKNAAIEWAQKNPSDVVWLGLVKLRKTWTPFPVAREVGAAVRWTEALGYIAIVATAMAGGWKLRGVRGAWLFGMPCVYLAVLHAIFIGSVRYRQPGVLLLCPLAGAGCIAIIEWIRIRGQPAGNTEADEP
jgi:hypothetical protein